MVLPKMFVELVKYFLQGRFFATVRCLNGTANQSKLVIFRKMTVVYFQDDDNKKSEPHYRQPISIIVGSDTNVKDLSISSSSSSSSNSCMSSNSDVDTRTRLQVTLKGVGWPVVQSGLSTLLGKCFVIK